ncbi:MAG: nucleoside triphosphate pyrophosphohydrolase [Pseudomonadota bacterium]
MEYDDSQRLAMDPDGGMDRLLEIMRRLRDPKTGCPWDIEQTPATIAPYTIEEAYEVADAVVRDDMDDLKGELGDLLLQVVYFAQMGSEAGHFDFGAVVRAVSDKMVARHPHIFGDASRDKTAEDQVTDWERIKAAERAARADGVQPRVLGEVALGLPGMTRAVKLQKRAARVGFDWPKIDQVVDKIAEEAGELAATLDAPKARQVEEFGDLMFVMANLARWLDIDPEDALRGANRKFERRFAHIEDALAAQGRSPAQSTLEEMDALWDAAKEQEKGMGLTCSPGLAVSARG